MRDPNRHSPAVDGDPRARYLPSLIADKVAGLHRAYAALAAIIHGLRTGEGHFVEAPMFETFTHFMLKEYLAGQTFDPPVGTICYGRQIDPDHLPFPTAGGYISIVPYTDASFAKVFSILGAPSFMDQPQFATPQLRAINIGQLYRGIAALTLAGTSQEWVSAFKAASIPAMAVRDIGDVRQDPHQDAAGLFQPRRHPTEGDYFDMRAPVKFSADPGRQVAPPASVGQHNEQIRKSLWSAGVTAAPLASTSN